MQLDDLPQILDQMLSKQKEKKQKTFVARYNGQNLIMRSGKSSWRQIRHAKSAIANHFHGLEYQYKWATHLKYGDADYRKIITAREKEFRAKLFELIKIVELTD
jgi:hypothetical protein